MVLSNKFSPIQKINTQKLREQKITLLIKRDDTLHTYISGNKWRKLKYNIQEAIDEKHTTLLTFGGAFSNHITATAAAAQLANLKSIGIIRGERIDPLNPTLSYAQRCGMHLHFVSRTTYRQKTTTSFQQQLKEKFGDFYLIPEGGTNSLALRGCAEIIEEVKQQLKDQLPSHFCVACGTGGTIGGMITGLKNHQKIIGFSALKGNFIASEVNALINNYDSLEYHNWKINTDYHFGGYAKFKPALIDFINQFKKDFDIPLDPIYTGKMMYGIFDLLEKNFFPPQSTILAVHTGGLQGIAGFNQRFGNLII